MLNTHAANELRESNQQNNTTYLATRMIAAEAFTYAVSGLIAGFGIGIPLSRFLYIGLITRHLGVEWRLSGALIGIVIVFVVFSALIAVYAPAKRICSLSPNVIKKWKNHDKIECFFT